MKLKTLRNMILICSLIFTLTLMFTVIMGMQHNNTTIVQVFLVSIAYTILSNILFWRKLIDKIGFNTVQIIYVILLNAIYIICTELAGERFTAKGYIVNAIFSLVAFLIIKVIIFNLDKAETNRINEFLRSRKEPENK